MARSIHRWYPALGFPRTAILAAFLVESLLLGFVGGLAGLVAASLGFALAMGFVGGFLPAARAARMKIVDALRAA